METTVLSLMEIMTLGNQHLLMAKALAVLTIINKMLLTSNLHLWVKIKTMGAPTVRHSLPFPSDFR